MQAVDMLEEAGYGIVEASNADDAIAILETRKDIRIVFTDIEMPGSGSIGVLAVTAHFYTVIKRYDLYRSPVNWKTDCKGILSVSL